MKDLSIVLKEVGRERKDILLSILFGFIAGITAVGLFASSGYLISKAALLPPLYALTVMIALLKMFGLARAAGRYGERLYSHRATFTILSNLRTGFFEKIEPLAPGIYQKYRSGDLLSRIVGDVESLQNFFLRVYYPPIVLIIVFLSTILFTSFFSITIAIVFILGLILTGFIVPALFSWNKRGLESKVRERRGELSTEVTELLYGFRELKLYQRLEEKEQLLTKASEEYIQEQERDGIQSIFNVSVNTAISLMVSWTVLAIGAYLVVEGELDRLFLAMLVMISLTVFENATPMAALPGHLEDSRRASSRLYSVVKEQPVKTKKPKVTLLSSDALSIDFEGVSYRFEGEQRNALNRVSLSIPAGSKTAIVGPSGSGKSTLLMLLLKVLHSEGENVLIGGQPVTHINAEDIWEKANVVLQDNHFFYGTIRENLEIAREKASDEEFIQVLEKVDLSHFTLDSEVYERGENLSGGEKQRLAIARAMLKNERLWILDEPTSSIDALTEQAIYKELLSKAADDTLVLVSHRLTGLEKMDQIIVMENGEIVESGSFNELMAKQGYFYEMKRIEKSVFG
ncbi:thiol reductant ABC exporter subunit CydC [Jeotgalibacillus proteolyticus]|uniref:Thiol reductant ABC exporter subunit CydC n=1 Tax=Jeotgalibacillus proteolyticus TaxID=2082395 RepID=A0A2S5GCL2_9BACL|nr:thiol reductant ABC exporter subunit CydC [Jeotgalibacillus proteolyticus]PPA70772.1 thiol reductant ABC exporter subunit CydC [Jeotgalibacillus proteolyticus]